MIESEALTRLNRKLGKIGDDLNKAAEKIPGEIAKRLHIGANDIRNTIILSMRNTKRGKRFYWRSKGRKVKKSGTGFLKSAKRHYSSAPGEPPAIDYGGLIRTIMFDVRGMEMEVGSKAGAPYSEFLEFGTPKMEARPWLNPAVEKHEKEILDNIGEGAIEWISKSFEGIMG